MERKSPRGGELNSAQSHAAEQLENWEKTWGEHFPWSANFSQEIHRNPGMSAKVLIKKGVLYKKVT